MESSAQRGIRGVVPKEMVVARIDVGTELFNAIRDEINDSAKFSPADAIRIFQLGVVFLRDFTAIDKLSKHKILIATIERVVDTVEMPESTRELLKALVATDIFDGLIQAVYAKFDLNADGKITSEEVHEVCCGPNSCCVPRGTTITAATSASALPPPPPHFSSPPPADGAVSTPAAPPASTRAASTSSATRAPSKAHKHTQNPRK